MANKGGALANIGQALSGYGSALSGNPMFLQNSLIMRQMQDQRRQQEQEQRQNQVGNAAAMSFLRTQGMEGTPETKQFQVNGKTYGQNAPATKMGDPLSMFSKFAGGGTPLQSIAAQRAMNELFPQATAPVTLAEGAVLTDPVTGKTIASNQRQEKPKFSPGETRTFERGDRTITQEYQADGTWANIADAPRWQMQEALTPKQTPAQKAVDEAFAKDYTAWITGGASDVQKNLGQLDMALNALNSGADNLTGPVIGTLPRAVRERVAPRSIDVQEMVEEVGQRNLRLVLGPQFTEKEGERLIARIYNPAQDESVNARRAQILFNQIKKAAEDKQRAAQYYEQNGTLNGFQGSLYTSVDQFRNDLDAALEEDGATTVDRRNDPLGLRGR